MVSTNGRGKYLLDPRFAQLLALKEKLASLLEHARLRFQALFCGGHVHRLGGGQEDHHRRSRHLGGGRGCDHAGCFRSPALLFSLLMK